MIDSFLVRRLAIDGAVPQSSRGPAPDEPEKVNGPFTDVDGRNEIVEGRMADTSKSRPASQASYPTARYPEPTAGQSA